MAVLTADQLLTARRQMAERVPPTWTKPQINAAVQAIEDAMVGTANVGNRSVSAHISQAIEAAAPGRFTVGQKDTLFILWSYLNAARGGIR